MRGGRWVALSLLGLLAAAGASAWWLAPADPLELGDPAGAGHLPPGARSYLLSLQDGRVRVVVDLERDGDWIEGIRSGSPFRVEAERLSAAPVSRVHPLGTDALGRDLLRRLIRGIRYSGTVAATVTLLSLAIGAAVGSWAALGGPLAERIAMRTVDLFLAFPRLVLFLLVATVAGPSAPWLVLVLAATGWPVVARLVRAGLAAARSREFADSARAAGGSPLRVTGLHLLPQARPALAVAAALLFADTLLLESAVAFIGLGAPPPAVSLGTIIGSGRGDLVEAWWVVAFPGLVLTTLVLCVRAVASAPPVQTRLLP